MDLRYINFIISIFINFIFERHFEFHNNTRLINNYNSKCQNSRLYYSLRSWWWPLLHLLPSSRSTPESIQVANLVIMLLAIGVTGGGENTNATGILKKKHVRSWTVAKPWSIFLRIIVSGGPALGMTIPIPVERMTTTGIRSSVRNTDRIVNQYSIKLTFMKIFF